jgi:hypothetical protein
MAAPAKQKIRPPLTATSSSKTRPSLAFDWTWPGLLGRSDPEGFAIAYDMFSGRALRRLTLSEFGERAVQPLPPRCSMPALRHEPPFPFAPATASTPSGQLYASTPSLTRVSPGLWPKIRSPAAALSGGKAAQGAPWLKALENRCRTADGLAGPPSVVLSTFDAARSSVPPRPSVQGRS